MNDFNVFIDDLPLWSAPFGQKLLDTLIYKKNINVLDIGCGEGFPLIEIAARFGKTSSFFGLEPLAKPLERLVYKKQLYQLPTVHAVQGTAETLPFDNHCFDLIVSNNGVNNVQDISRAFRECRRVVRRDGQMVIAVNTEQTMREFYTLFEQILIQHSMTTAVARMKDHIRKKRLPQNILVQGLGKAGFEVTKIICDSFTMKFADGTALLNHYLIRSFFLNGWKQLVDEDRTTEIFNAIEGRLNDMAKTDSMVCLTIPFMVLDCRAI